MGWKGGGTEIDSVGFSEEVLNGKGSSYLDKRGWKVRAYILQQLRDTLTKEQFKQHPHIRTYFGGTVKVIIQKS